MKNKLKDVVSGVSGNVAWKTKADESRTFLNPLTVAIARLTDAELCRLNREDLIDLGNYSVLGSLSNNADAQLSFADDVQLKRLACLARYACRRNVNFVFSTNGIKCPFLECV